MKKIIFLLTFFLLLYTPYIVEAENEYNIISEIESPEGFEFLDVAESVKSGKLPITFSDVLKKVASLFFESIKTNIPRIVKIITLAILSGILVNLGEEKNDIGTFSAVAVVSTVAIKIFSDSVFLVNETIDGLFIFINSLITPLITMSSVGTVAYAPVAAGVFVSMQVFMHLCKSTLMPLICVICVFSVCDKIGNTPYLMGITNILKQILKWGTGLLITVYTVVIGLQSQTASAFDNLAGKTVKYAVGSFVPIVGGALSDSLETVILGAKTMAKVLGISGVLGVCYIAITPLINVIAISLSFKIASAVTSVTSEKRVSSVIDEFAQSIAKVSIVLLSCAVMFIISIAMLLGHGG